MEQVIGCDAHKKFSVLVAVKGHDPLAYRDFLAQLPAHSAIAQTASVGVCSASDPTLTVAVAAFSI
jgi:hypothetical protein